MAYFKKVYGKTTNLTEKDFAEGKQILDHIYPKAPTLTQREQREINEAPKEVQKEIQMKKGYQMQVKELQYVHPKDGKSAFFKGKCKHKNGAIQVFIKTNKWIEDNFQLSFVMQVKNAKPGTWVHVPIGAPNNEIADYHLLSDVPVAYTQQQTHECIF